MPNLQMMQPKKLNKQPKKINKQLKQLNNLQIKLGVFGGLT